MKSSIKRFVLCAIVCFLMGESQAAYPVYRWQSGPVVLPLALGLAVQSCDLQASSRQGKSRRFAGSKIDRSYAKKRSMKRSDDGRGYAQHQSQEHVTLSANQEVENKKFDSDPEVDRCVVDIAHLYVSKNLVSKKAKNRIFSLMELKQGLLMIKSDPLLLTHKVLESLIKGALPILSARKKTRSGRTLLLNKELTRRVESFCMQNLCNKEALVDNLVPFVFNTINEMIQLFNDSGFGAGPKSNDSGFRSGKQDEWLRDEIAEQKKIYVDEREQEAYEELMELAHEERMELAQAKKAHRKALSAVHEEMMAKKAHREALSAVHDEMMCRAWDKACMQKRGETSDEESEVDARLSFEELVKENERLIDAFQTEQSQRLREQEEEWHKDFDAWRLSDAEKVLSDYEISRHLVEASRQLVRSERSEENDFIDAHALAKSRNRKKRPDCIK